MSQTNMLVSAGESKFFARMTPYNKAVQPHKHYRIAPGNSSFEIAFVAGEFKEVSQKIAMKLEQIYPNGDPSKSPLFSIVSLKQKRMIQKKEYEADRRRIERETYGATETPYNTDMEMELIDPGHDEPEEDKDGASEWDELSEDLKEIQGEGGPSDFDDVADELESGKDHEKEIAEEKPEAVTEEVKPAPAQPAPVKRTPVKRTATNTRKKRKVAKPKVAKPKGA